MQYRQGEVPVESVERLKGMNETWSAVKGRAGVRVGKEGDKKA